MEEGRDEGRDIFHPVNPSSSDYNTRVWARLSQQPGALSCLTRVQGPKGLERSVLLSRAH